MRRGTSTSIHRSGWNVSKQIAYIAYLHIRLGSVAFRHATLDPDIQRSMDAGVGGCENRGETDTYRSRAVKYNEIMDWMRLIAHLRYEKHSVSASNRWYNSLWRGKMGKKDFSHGQFGVYFFCFGFVWSLFAFIVAVVALLAATTAVMEPTKSNTNRVSC